MLTICALVWCLVTPGEAIEVHQSECTLSSKVSVQSTTSEQETTAAATRELEATDAAQMQGPVAKDDKLQFFKLKKDTHLEVSKNHLPPSKETLGSNLQSNEAARVDLSSFDTYGLYVGEKYTLGVVWFVTIGNNPSPDGVSQAPYEIWSTYLMPDAISPFLEATEKVQDLSPVAEAAAIDALRRKKDELLSEQHAGKLQELLKKKEEIVEFEEFQREYHEGIANANTEGTGSSVQAAVDPRGDAD